MMKRLIIYTLILLMPVVVFSEDRYKYAIHFTDKENTPFSISNPEAYLSQKAIDRRAKFNIPVIEEDLPIDPGYITQVLEVSDDAKLLIQVKWLNAIIISLSDTSIIELINEISHVEMTRLVFRPDSEKSSNKMDFTVESVEVNNNVMKSLNEYDSAFYGGAWTQIQQLNGHKLHEMGYTGSGMTIAVLDAGFTNTDNLRVFDKLRNNGQILGTANFVAPGDPIFSVHSHGTAVLSTMGGYWEGNLVGTAPDANYWLIRTEDAATEYLVEEYNWLAGAAFADSVGADILNTSLGYTTFDDSEMDHTWEELNGDSTVITRGSNMAFRKGMLVVNSAGNSGNSSWKYVGAPADGYQVLSIGAVDDNGEIASFSSYGFPESEFIKPEVVARGKGTFVAYTSGAVGPGNGTSFSSPVLAGMAACLWQVDPNLSPFMIKQAIYYSSNRFLNPDNRYGYGLPDFVEAMNILGIEDQLTNQQTLMVVPNPFTNDFKIIKENLSATAEWKIFNLQGQLILSGLVDKNQSEINIALNNQPSGLYIFQLTQNGKFEQIKLNKL
jgi:serine protease AprX